MTDSIDTRRSLHVNGREYRIHQLTALPNPAAVERLPFALKILLENLLRHQDGVHVTAADMTALSQWDVRAGTRREIAFTPARVLLQDFTGVPAIVDLAAMREAMVALGGDPQRINPLCPAELVIDHSVQVDHYRGPDALAQNTALEFRRNHERYTFLRWGQNTFANLDVVPPGTGIVHQVNLEHLARVVFTADTEDGPWAYPDTLVGTDSHTTMINGLGVLGWGVGGIEAEAAMLGQPISMLIPEVLGVRLTGRLPEGATATDLVLTVTERLRAHGVVGRFVEFFGPGLDHLPLADRATLANMAPEYGATCGIFPVDGETLRYLELSGRSREQIDLVEAYARTQGLYRTSDSPEPHYTETLEVAMDRVEPSLAGPRRPQDRVALSGAKGAFESALNTLQAERSGDPTGDTAVAQFQGEGGDTAIAAEEAQHTGVKTVTLEGTTFELRDGAVVVAAITSCTNTSNPEVMLAAGLLARAARNRGLTSRPWVKTSLAPGSQVVTEYLRSTGLLEDLEAIGFQSVGYGCTTCIGNSGPLAEPIAEAITTGELITASVLSGNRNFEGRIHPQVRMNYLASPPLVVAYALAGTLDVDLQAEPLAWDTAGQPVYFRDLWPSRSTIQAVRSESVTPGMFQQTYASVFTGDERWQALPVTDNPTYDWDPASTYIRQPDFFRGITREPPPLEPLEGAYTLCLLGDSVTTDHISPAGAIPGDSPAGQYLQAQGVAPSEFNSYGARRGNHEVMLRGTFANIRLRNRMAPGTEGGWTTHVPSGDRMTVFDAAQRYRAAGLPLIVIAGTEYGTGSSRDWAAKGTRLLGVKAVIAASFERIHRSNLIGMGVLPLQFPADTNAETLGITGQERFSLAELTEGAETVQLIVEPPAGAPWETPVRIRIDTPMEWQYYRHGGILPFVLRRLLEQDPDPVEVAPRP